MGHKLLRWSFFDVLIALFPVLWAAISLQMRGDLSGLELLLGQGQLLLLSAALLSSALAGLLVSKNFTLIKVAVGGASILLLITAGAAYGDVTRSLMINDPNPPSTVASYSLWLYVAALGASICSLVLEHFSMVLDDDS